MRNLKRALSLALASVMLLGMMVVGTSAASYTDVDENDNVEAIEVLNAVDVMIGRQGNFEPDEPVKRHEMATIMAKLVLGVDTADNYVGSHPYTDVVPWADKYVAACYENDLISGTSSTTFSGNQDVTAVQAALMVLRALGYKDLNKGAADWRAPVTAAANRIRLFDGVASNPSQKLNRNEVAQLVLNALKSPVVDMKEGLSITGSNGDYTFTIDGNREYIARSSREAYAYAINRTELAGTSASSISGATVELGEHLYNGSLKLYDDRTDVFGRPARKWEYDGKSIGTYAKDELLRQEYVGKVTGRNLYDLLGSETIRDYDITVTIDGINNKAVDSNVFTAADMNKNNNATVGATGTGTLTQVYVDTQNKDVYVAIINTYLAIAEDDYDEKKEELSVTAYAMKKTGNEYIKSRTSGDDYVSAIKLSVEDFDVKNVKKDDALLITVADGDVQTMAAAEVLSGVQLSAFKKGSNVTSNGTKYEYTTTAEYKYGDLDVYTNSGAGGSINLKDLTYNIYLDAYGNLIGIEEVESVNNYMFITGIDTNGSNITNTTADANVLFLDGTSETVKINLAKSTLTLKSGSKNAILNTWCTYTKNNSDVYTVTQVKDATSNALNVPGQSGNSGKLAQYHQSAANDGTDKDFTIDQRNITLLGGGNNTVGYAAVYGNKDTVYLTAELDELTNGATYGVISGVESVTTGVINANLTVWKSATAVKAADDSKTPAPTAPTSATASKGVYTLYNNDGVIIAAVVVGEDAAAAKNLVYVHSSGLEEEAYGGSSTRANDGEWTWTRKVIQDGKEVLLTEVGDSSTYLEPMVQYQWYQIKKNGSGNVVGQELASKALTKATDGDYVNVKDYVLGSTVINGKDTILFHTDDGAATGGLTQKLNLIGNTLFIDSKANKGFYVDADVNVVLQQWDKNSKETYIETGVGVDKLKSFINEIGQYDATARKTSGDAAYRPYYVSAILEKGVAKTVVLYDTFNSYIRPDDPTVITENVSATVDGNVVKVVFTDKNFNALDLRNAASNALKAAGYTSVNTFTLTVPPDGAASNKGTETPITGYVMAMDSEKDMTFFTVTYINRWSVKVDGVLREYVWDDDYMTVTEKSITGDGSGYIATFGGVSSYYHVYKTTDVVAAGAAAVKIDTYVEFTTGAVKLGTSPVSVTADGTVTSTNTFGTNEVKTDNAGTPVVYALVKDGLTVKAEFAATTLDTYGGTPTNVGTYDVTVKVTYASGTPADASTEPQEMEIKASANTKTDLTFDLSSLLTDQEINAIAIVVTKKLATYTLKTPVIADGSAADKNGLTITAVADKTEAKAGETVTVTVTVQGKVTVATDLDISCTNGTIGTWATTNTNLAGMAGGGTASLKLDATVNFVLPETFYFTYVATDNGAEPTITVNNG